MNHLPAPLLWRRLSLSMINLIFNQLVCSLTKFFPHLEPHQMVLNQFILWRWSFEIKCPSNHDKGPTTIVDNDDSGGNMCSLHTNKSTILKCRGN